MIAEGWSPVGPGSRPEVLLEREAELHTIRAALARMPDGAGSMIVVEGEPGIGKSSLLDRAVSAAREAAITVLATRGRELEGIHPFGVVGSLFGETALAAHDLFDGPAKPARAVLDPTSAAAVNVDRQSLVHALYWLTLNVADAGPLLLVVDDAHWADEASLEFISYLGTRVASMPVVLLVALRPAQASRTVIGEQVRSHRDAVRLRLAPLSAEAVEALIDRSTDDDLSDERRASIIDQTAGNPFYIVELLRSARHQPPVGGGAVRADGVPDAIQASIRRRLADEKRVARRIAEAIAVLGDEASVERAARLAGTSIPDTLDAIRHMTERAILDARRLDFIHPIVRTAVLESIPDPVRGELHRTAAIVLADSGASPMAAAGHLLSSEPGSDPTVVAILRAAAHAAMGAADAPAAARFLARALDEHPDETVRPGLLLELARAEAASGAPGAAARFEEAVRHIDDPTERARARLAQGHALIQATRWPDAIGAFSAGLADVDEADVELKSRLEAGYISSAYVAMTDVDEANRRLERILASPLTDPAHRELAAWSAFQSTLQLSTTAERAASLARRAVTGVELETLIDSSQAVEIAAGVFLATGDLVEEVDLLTRAMDAANRLNAYGKTGVYAYCRSLPNYLMGRLHDAIADGETAIAAHELGWEVFYPGTCAALAWSYLERGDLARAHDLAQIDESRWGQRLDFEFMTRIARGRIALARGDATAALAEFDRAEAAGTAIGVRSTHVLADWRTWSVVALRGLDRRDDAIRAAETASNLAAGWGESVAIARAAWAMGMAHGGSEGIEHLRRSVALLESGPARLELARATTDLGAALRRAGSLAEAREILVRAADLAHRIGALAILERARSELQAAGARPRRYTLTGVDALTPSELRVARLAAEGRTNRAIAQALFVTPKAVEYHLANAYRKLEIRSRSELGGALGATPEAASV